MDDYLGRKKGSHMWQHVKNHHRGHSPRRTDFQVSIISQHKSSLTRQVKEAITIRKVQGILLNNKKEYTRCYLPQWQLTGNPNKSKNSKHKYTGDENTDWSEESKKPQRKRKAAKDEELNIPPDGASSLQQSQSEPRSKRAKTSLKSHKYKFYPAPKVTLPLHWTKWAERLGRDESLGTLQKCDDDWLIPENFREIFEDPQGDQILDEVNPAEETIEAGETPDKNKKKRYKKRRAEDMEELTKNSDEFWSEQFIKSYEDPKKIQECMR